MYFVEDPFFFSFTEREALRGIFDGGGNGEKSSTDLTDRGILDWRYLQRYCQGVLPSTH